MKSCCQPVVLQGACIVRHRNLSLSLVPPENSIRAKKGRARKGSRNRKTDSSYEGEAAGCCRRLAQQREPSEGILSLFRRTFRIVFPSRFSGSQSNYYLSVPTHRDGGAMLFDPPRRWGYVVRPSGLGMSEHPAGMCSQ